METQNKPIWEVQQSQESIIAEAEYEKKEVKHYPKPKYCKCNAGHTLVEMFNEKRNCFDWDCPICIAKMQITEPKCKFCEKTFNPNGNWRNDCPKEFCTWYCAHEQKHKEEYLKSKEKN
jgi:hypothetical protein